MSGLKGRPRENVEIGAAIGALKLKNGLAPAMVHAVIGAAARRTA